MMVCVSCYTWLALYFFPSTLQASRSKLCPSVRKHGTPRTPVMNACCCGKETPVHTAHRVISWTHSVNSLTVHICTRKVQDRIVLSHPTRKPNPQPQPASRKTSPTTSQSLWAAHALLTWGYACIQQLQAKTDKIRGACISCVQQQQM